VELREYLQAMRRRWRLVLTMVVLSVAAVAALTFMSPPTYKSSTTLFISASDNGPDAGAARLNSYITLLTGPRIATAVKSQLELPYTVAETQKKISADIQSGTNLLVVSATDGSASRARAIATAASEQLVTVVRSLEPTADGSNAAAAAPTPVTINVAQEAVTSPAPRNAGRNLGFAAVLGLLLGAGGTALRETLHRTVITERDLRRTANLDTVGVIALAGEAGRTRRVRKSKADSALAEAFRKLRIRLPYGPSSSAVAPASLLVTSSVPREGTTAIACGLAMAMAETGSRVVLVDANLREPEVSKYLSLDATAGLADVLTGTFTVDEMLHEWGHGRLHVLPAGYTVNDPGELLATPGLAQTIATLEDRFDVVIVDAPPLLSSADAAVLSKLTSGTLLVVRSGATRTEEVERAVTVLHGVGARVVGGVLNALPKKLRGPVPWHRPEQPPQWRIPEQPTALAATPAEEPELDVSDLGSDSIDETAAARGRAQVVIPAPSTPARGRARVVIDAESSPARPAAVYGAPAAEQPAAGSPATEQPRDADAEPERGSGG
jgi:capsular exopolysaccharide synthesis family protein